MGSAAHTELNTARTELNAAYTKLDTAHTELDPAHTELDAAYTDFNAAHMEPRQERWLESHAILYLWGKGIRGYWQLPLICLCSCFCCAMLLCCLHSARNTSTGEPGVHTSGNRLSDIQLPAVQHVC
jgi:hypothetical protein